MSRTLNVKTKATFSSYQKTHPKQKSTLSFLHTPKNHPPPPPSHHTQLWDIPLPDHGFSRELLQVVEIGGPARLEVLEPGQVRVEVLEAREVEGVEVVETGLGGAAAPGVRAEELARDAVDEARVGVVDGRGHSELVAVEERPTAEDSVGKQASWKSGKIQGR